MNWIKGDKELPDEVFTYGCESADVWIASKCRFTHNWQYGVAYVVRSSKGVEWVSVTGHALKESPDYWGYINSPENP